MSQILEAGPTQRSEAFAASLLERLNGGFTAIGMSIGHRTGLFDALAGMPPTTAQQIATTVGLHERYVREWLGLMVVSGVIEYDAATSSYALPGDHAAVLTRSAGADNLAMTAQHLSALARVEDDIVECFHRGGGAALDAYQRFQQVMAEEALHVQDSALLRVTLPLFPGVLEMLRRGARVLEIGCGHGHALNVMAAAFPASRFDGIDLSPSSIDAARAEAAALGLDNVSFEVRDAGTLDAESAYDLVVAIDVIHDLPQPAQTLAAIRRALRNDGALLMIDIAASSRLEQNVDHPLAPFLYAASMLHCISVSLRQDGAALGACWGEQTAQAMLADAGFESVAVTRVPHDILNTYYLARPQEV